MTRWTKCNDPCFRADIALIGLAVMGQNLIMNMNDHGFVVRRSLLFVFISATFEAVKLLIIW